MRDPLWGTLPSLQGFFPPPASKDKVSPGKIFCKRGWLTPKRMGPQKNNPEYCEPPTQVGIYYQKAPLLKKKTLSRKFEVKKVSTPRNFGKEALSGKNPSQERKLHSLMNPNILGNRGPKKSWKPSKFNSNFPGQCPGNKWGILKAKKFSFRKMFQTLAKTGPNQNQ